MVTFQEHQQLGYLHKYLLWLMRIRVDASAHWESPTKKAEADLLQQWYGRYVRCTSALDPEQLNAAFMICIELATELFAYFDAPEDISQLLRRMFD